MSLETTERIQEAVEPAIDVIQEAAGTELWTPETADENRLGDPMDFLRGTMTSGIEWVPVYPSGPEIGPDLGEKPYRAIDVAGSVDFLQSMRGQIVAVRSRGKIRPAVLASRLGDCDAQGNPKLEVVVLGEERDVLSEAGIIIPRQAKQLQDALVEENKQDGRYHGEGAGSAANAAHFGVAIGTVLEPAGWGGVHDTVHELAGHDANDTTVGFSRGIAQAGLHDASGQGIPQRRDVESPDVVLWHEGFVRTTLPEKQPGLEDITPVGLTAATYYAAALRRYELQDRPGKLQADIAGNLVQVQT